MAVKKIGLYIKEILYNVGGTESCSAKFASALQTLFPEAEVCFVSECYAACDKKSDADFVSMVNRRFGVSIDQGRCRLIAVNCKRDGKFNSYFISRRIVSESKQFDLFVYCSKGSLAFKAKKNVAIIHFPMNPAECERSRNPLSRLRGRLRNARFAKSYDVYLPNSFFTEKYMRQYWPSVPSGKIVTVYHPVAPVPATGEAKEHIILACSRIEPSKHLEMLIDAYKSSELLRGHYRFVIAGNVDMDNGEYNARLKDYVAGSGVELVQNAPWSEIVSLYNRAEIFWHCKGYGESDPYKMEHFGMTTVEAMSAGCVPVVINRGGQCEIVAQGCGFKWETPQELVAYTERLASDPVELSAMSQAARRRAQDFSMQSFTENLRAVLKSVVGE